MKSLFGLALLATVAVAQIGCDKPSSPTLDQKIDLIYKADANKLPLHSEEPYTWVSVNCDVGTLIASDGKAYDFILYPHSNVPPSAKEGK
jgi:hypothetical protein